MQQQESTPIQNRIGEVIESKFGKERISLSESIYKEVLCIPKKTFGRYLKNEAQPRLDELQRIAQWIGAAPKELF
jgi:hypothetical protein